MNKVKVPSPKSPDKDICWEQWHGTNQYEALQAGIILSEHCTLPRGHLGKHTFERYAVERVGSK